LGLAAFLRSPLSRLVLRPAYDRMAVWAISRHYFPLSRAWAAALAAEGDADRLAAAIPAYAGRRRAADQALTRLGPRIETYEAAVRRWEDAFFGSALPDAGALADIERSRALAAQSLMLGRVEFLRHRLAKGVPPIAWSMVDREAVELRHGRRLAAPAAAFPAAGVARFDTSRVITGPRFDTHWLRTPSDVGGESETLWARVERPHGEGPHPVLIFTHGICMEMEYWLEEDGPAQRLAASGLAVVRPEGPYHGRRRRTGYFGGEPVFALGPMGMLNYFEAHVRELGELIAWARAEFGGPVAVGGVSLGALSAQLVVGAAAHWPPEMRPDAALLVTSSASVLEAAVAGSLPRAIGAADILDREGWTRDRLEHWAPLLQPGGAQALAGEKIVMLLGRRDTITPYAEGEALVRKWQVPDVNLFQRDLGHFTASLSLYRDPAPFDRLRAVLNEV
jgi:hypothetical protein